MGDGLSGEGTFEGFHGNAAAVDAAVSSGFVSAAFGGFASGHALDKETFADAGDDVAVAFDFDFLAADDEEPGVVLGWLEDGGAAFVALYWYPFLLLVGEV